MTRTLWLDWHRLHGKPRTEQCRQFWLEASKPGHTWSEHFDVVVDITINEPRRRNQKRSKVDLRTIESLALDAIIGPIVAKPARSPARVQGVHTTKRWATDNPGVMIVIRTHEENDA